MAYSHLVMSSSIISFSARDFVYESVLLMFSRHVGHLNRVGVRARVRHARQNVCPSVQSDTGSRLTCMHMLHSSDGGVFAVKMCDGYPLPRL